MSLMSAGLTGLNAAQLGLTTTAHNIANASTPGYNRQEVLQTTQVAQLTGAGSLGQGVAVDTIRRVYSEFLNRQVVSGQSQTSATQAFNAQIGQIDSLLADPSAGMGPALQDLFNSVQNLANDPATAATRQAMLGSANAMVARFQQIDQRLGEMRTGINQQIGTTVAQINTIATQIAQANANIALAEPSEAQPANDLRDQRDQLVLELNKLTGATVVKQGNSYNVTIGNGVPVVIGTNAQRIGVFASPTDPGHLQVGVATAAGTVQIQESLLQGGSLGGMLAFRSQSLEPAQNALGRIAIVLGTTFNAQHVLGQDLNGALGGNFFNVAQPQVSSSANNTGSAQLSASFSNVGALTTSDYGITYTGSSYIVTRLSDSTQQTFASLPATIDGVALGVASGTPSAGDKFTLRPTAGGAYGLSVAVTDPNKIAAAAPIRTAAGTANTGSATISAGSVSAPLNANVQQAVTITFTSPTTFDVSGTGTGNPTGVAYTPGAAISYNGWTTSITGTPAAGDTFTTKSNVGGIADNRNALLLGSLQTKSTIANGTASYQGAYGQLVSDVGTQARQSNIALEAQQTFLEQTRQSQQSFSGVNLDEEAANLVRYQQAYQASARVIQIGSSLFQDLMNIFG